MKITVAWYWISNKSQGDGAIIDFKNTWTRHPHIYDCTYGLTETEITDEHDSGLVMLSDYHKSIQHIWSRQERTQHVNTALVTTLITYSLSRIEHRSGDYHQ